MRTMGDSAWRDRIGRCLVLPTWTLTSPLLLDVLGFPITLVLAWAFDLWPNGLTLDVAISQREDRGPVRISLLNALVVVALLCALLVPVGQPGRIMADPQRCRPPRHRFGPLDRRYTGSRTRGSAHGGQSARAWQHVQRAFRCGGSRGACQAAIGPSAQSAAAQR